MQFSAEITLNDHRDCLAYYLAKEAKSNPVKKQNRFAEWVLHHRLLLLCGALGLIGLIYGLYFEREAWWQGSLIVLLACLAAWSHSPKFMSPVLDEGDEIDESVVRDGFNVGQARFNLEPESLEVEFGSARTSYSWRNFLVFEEAPEAFYLMVHGGDLLFPGDHVVVPKRALTNQEMVEQFRDLCQSHIGPSQ